MHNHSSSGNTIPRPNSREECIWNPNLSAAACTDGVWRSSGQDSILCCTMIPSSPVLHPFTCSPFMGWLHSSLRSTRNWKNSIQSHVDLYTWQVSSQCNSSPVPGWSTWAGAPGTTATPLITSMVWSDWTMRHCGSWPVSFLKKLWQNKAYIFHNCYPPII